MALYANRYDGSFIRYLLRQDMQVEGLVAPCTIGGEQAQGRPGCGRSAMGAIFPPRRMTVLPATSRTAAVPCSGRTTGCIVGRPCTWGVQPLGGWSKALMPGPRSIRPRFFRADGMDFPSLKPVHLSRFGWMPAGWTMTAIGFLGAGHGLRLHQRVHVRGTGSGRQHPELGAAFPDASRGHHGSARRCDHQRSGE